MAYNQVNWQNRSVERTSTYILTTNPDDTITLVRAEGVIKVEGTKLDASNLNIMDTGIFTNSNDIVAVNSLLVDHLAKIQANTTDINTINADINTINEDIGDKNLIHEDIKSMDIVGILNYLYEHKGGVGGETIVINGAEVIKMTSTEELNHASSNPDVPTKWVAYTTQDAPIGGVPDGVAQSTSGVITYVTTNFLIAFVGKGDTISVYRKKWVPFVWGEPAHWDMWTLVTNIGGA